MSDEENNCIKVNDVFEELCRQLSSNDQVGDISQKFSTLNTNAERVKFTGDLLEKYALYPKIIHEKKDDELSVKYRQEGNDAFKRKQDHAAWMFYSKSISFATSNSECLALAYANRSAVLYEKKMYKQCLEDITNAFKNNYPKRLHEKLIQREEKARELQSSEATDKYFERPSGLKEANREIPCASAKVEIRRTKALGRHVVAKRRIKIGEMVAVERPFVSVLLKDHLRDHCYSCLTLCYSTIPCERCVYAMFCSRTCQQQAWEQHHKYECPMLATLYAMDVSKMTLAALRIALVARKHYGELDKYNGDHGGGGGVYRSQSYGEIHALEANTHLRNSSDLFPKATAAAVVRYVADKTSPSFRTEFAGADSAIFDELLMHHQQTAATNFHEINECAEDEEGRYVNTLEIGAGAYAFLSLFNHSCSPNVVRHCHGTEIIARAIKEIPAGVELLDNYG
ncbi:set and mynd domain-containing protein 4 [Holotrichia oblita]|uniref:Set and mynd domain-containing protein 4 n=1 Tax=Holotrichia oblita TaxID=644536 RepID=A0ACB9SUF5_HOLOL|nr:set and mynd domain-containing protein 4 [Holotrichia oblita]